MPESRSETKTSVSGTFDDISSFNSENSYRPEEFVGKLSEHKESSGADLPEGSEDINKMKSAGSDMNTLRVQNSAGTKGTKELRNTASAVSNENNSLKEENSLRKAITIAGNNVPDNIPISEQGRSVFPDEYTVETDTGLVKAKTAEKVDRMNTRQSTATSKKSAGLDPKKLENAIEKNKEEIENYKQHKKGRNVFKKLFGKIFS